MKLILKILTDPVAVLSIIASIALFSILSALITEAVFKIEPCIMCIYQRIPFVIAFVITVTGLFLHKHPPLQQLTILLCAPNFLINALMAFYHTGIERKWWISAVDGCIAPNFADDQQSILENILSAPTARCDEIPWADPILGLSMANYNIILCLGLSVFCILAFIKQRQIR